MSCATATPGSTIMLSVSTPINSRRMRPTMKRNERPARSGLATAITAVVVARPGLVEVPEVGGEARVVEPGAGEGPWRRCGGCWATSCVR